MPDLWMDVDTALAEVPVNLFPLIDDTDFKSIETGIVYNQAGLVLVWNFVTPAGAFTQTAVTPTDTGGNYDWVNQGNGMYTIEMPATGGASINNNTEGVGWFEFKATGILPMRGPLIGFRAAGLNDALIEAVYSATRGLAGTALPAAAADAAGGLPISDAGGLDLDVRLDAAITSRMATYTQPTGFLAATFPSDPADQSLVIAATDAIIADTNDIQSRLPAALVGGRMDSSIGAMAADVLTAAATAADFGTEIAAVIWNALTSGMVTAGSIGKKLADWVVGTIDTYTGNTKQTGDSFARLGAPAGASLAADVAAVQADTNDIQTRLPAALVGGRMSSDVGSVSGDATAADTLELFIESLNQVTGQIDNGTLHTELDTYQGRTELLDDDGSGNDRYAHSWIRNGELLASGITSPTIQVIKAADASDLVALTAMTEIGALGHFRYNEPTNRIVDGALYLILCRATIGGATHTWPTWIGRDSSV